MGVATVLPPLYYVMRKIALDACQKEEAGAFLDWIYGRSKGQHIAEPFEWWEKQWAEWKEQ